MPDDRASAELLVEVVVGEDEYGQPVEKPVPESARTHWDRELWSDRPPR